MLNRSSRGIMYQVSGGMLMRGCEQSIIRRSVVFEWPLPTIKKGAGVGASSVHTRTALTVLILPLQFGFWILSRVCPCGNAHRSVTEFYYVILASPAGH